MKNKLKILGILIIITFVLAACGTADIEPIDWGDGSGTAEEAPVEAIPAPRVQIENYHLSPEFGDTVNADLYGAIDLSSLSPGDALADWEIDLNGGFTLTLGDDTDMVRVCQGEEESMVEGILLENLYQGALVRGEQATYKINALGKDCLWYQYVSVEGSGDPISEDPVMLAHLWKILDNAIARYSADYRLVGGFERKIVVYPSNETTFIFEDRINIQE